MQSVVLLVDGEGENAAGGLVALIERNVDKASWRVVHKRDVESAQELFVAKSTPGRRNPALVVLNVDVRGGWPFCTALKKNHPTVPVVVVSRHLSKEVFNNHQKLDTRADAYHRLPDELEGLGISLSYFSSHQSETGHDDEGSQVRLRPRRPATTAVPPGVLQRLESTVAEQARALEDARRQIEALEAERDAVAEKNRRQMLELMAVAPSSSSDVGAEVQLLRERLSTLEAEALLSARREDELRQTRAALDAANEAVTERDRVHARDQQDRASRDEQVKRLQAELEALREGDDALRRELEAHTSELAALRSEKAQLTARLSEAQSARRTSPGMARPDLTEELEAAREEARREAVATAEQLAAVSVQLSTVASELKTAHERRVKAEEQRRAAEERASALEQALEDQVAERTRELELKLKRAAERAESVERAWGAVNTRVEELELMTQARAGEVERLKVEKKSIEDTLATSRRLMREYASEAARKAEELKALEQRVRELGDEQAKARARTEELQQAVDFEKSLVESLEKELAEGRARAPDEGAIEALRAELAAREAALSQLQTSHEAALAARATEHEAASSQLRAEHEAALSQLRAEHEAALNQLRAEHEAASNQLRSEHEAASNQLRSEHEAASSQLRSEHEAASSQLRSEHEAALGALREELEAAREALAQHAAGLAAARDERAAIEAHLAAVEARFEGVVTYARALEGRMVAAEGVRVSVEAALEALLAEVRVGTLTGEVPPSMDLPERTQP